MSIRSTIYRILYPFALATYFVFRPTTHGVKGIIRQGDNMLMVRHAYGSRRWNFPGGGIKRGELALQAVGREITEELGVHPRDWKLIGAFFNTLEYKKDTIEVFEGWVDHEEVIIDGQELIAAQWFPIGQLPPDSTLVAGMVIKVWNENHG